MENSDKMFWKLTKEISGLEQSRNKAAPSVDDLVDHFASKMSNAADVHDNDWVPPAHWKGKARLSSFKVDQRTILTVKRATSGWVPNRSHSTSEAEAEFDEMLWKVVKQHVKLRAPTKP